MVVQENFLEDNNIIFQIKKACSSPSIMNDKLLKALQHANLESKRRKTIQKALRKRNISDNIKKNITQS